MDFETFCQTVGGKHTQFYDDYFVLSYTQSHNFFGIRAVLGQPATHVITVVVDNR